MAENKQDRVDQLEELVAHQAVTIDELSNQLANQWKQIDRLSSKLDRLTERFLAVEEEIIPTPENTKPPHW